MTQDNHMPEDDQQLGIMEHLVELRARLIKAVIGAVVVLICLLPFMEKLFDFFSKPLLGILPGGGKMLAVGVISPVMAPLKLTLFIAFIISLPYIFYQIWSFASPGLYRREKRLVLPAISCTFLLFLLGIAYCYFIVFGMIFSFISGYAPESVQFAPDIDAYIGFILKMFVAFGFTFEVPMIVIFLHMTNIVPASTQAGLRRYVIAAAFILSAIFTPPDVVSQLMLAVPIIILFEIGILVAKLFSPSKKSVLVEE